MSQQSVDLVIVGSLSDTVAGVPETARRHARSETLTAQSRRAVSHAAGAFGLVLTIALSAVACGTSELEREPTFDGTWRVTALVDDGATVDLDGRSPQLEIDTGEAAVRGRTNCRELFGSYTLIDTGSSGGGASFTIPSPAADSSCDATDRAVHTSLVDTLESLTQWRQEGSVLTFQTQGQTVLELTPAG